jgi:hypothetical protein
MRTHGHTEAREQRDALIKHSNERLQEAYVAVEHHARTNLDVDYARYFILSYSQSLLEKCDFTLEQLHGLILRTPLHDQRVSKVLGLFVSAGYKQLALEKIIYDLHTPSLDYLAMNYCGQFIIDGTLGNNSCIDITGTLIINGTVGKATGHSALGTIENNGTAGDGLGEKMIGMLTSLPTKQNDGTNMLGIHNGIWCVNGRYPKPATQLTRFKDDLAHALTLPRAIGRSYLLSKYFPAFLQIA